MTPTKLLVGQIFIVFAIVILGVWAATQPDAAARAIGRDRFDRFIEQIGRQMAAGPKPLAQTSEARP